MNPKQAKELDDNARLLKAWRAFHREELERELAGPHGAMVERLVFILDGLNLESAPLLLAYIRGIDWSAIDYTTRLVVLHEVNTAITKVRTRNGLAPFDDGLPGDESNAFQVIKAIVI